MAGLVALFVLVDGMFFVQSRIGMNDVYVGMFIIAAYTVFAAVWTGWWRGRAAFWMAMPSIGVLLGLALASKWVAAYAIGALILLILVRSALGRVLAILGLIGITSVLGYLAITVPEGQGFGNLTFLIMMLALTLIAVVTAIVHPVAWTDEEMRLAVGAPVALGTLVFFVAVATGSTGAELALGPLAFTPLEIALALALGSGLVAVLFWFGGRIGFGPLASPPALRRSRPLPRSGRAAARRLAAPRLAARPAGRLRRDLPRRRCRWACTSSRTSRGRMVEGPPDHHRLAGRAQRPDPAGPDRPRCIAITTA